MKTTTLYRVQSTMTPREALGDAAPRLEKIMPEFSNMVLVEYFLVDTTKFLIEWTQP